MELTKESGIMNWKFNLILVIFGRYFLIYRAGWCQFLANPRVPVGYDEFGYSIREKDGSVFHCSRGKNYGESFSTGDVIGFLIELPDFDSSKSHQEILDQIVHQYPPKKEVEYEVKQEILLDSKITFFKNGKPLGIAFENIYRGKYYPAVSTYMGGTAKLNFGPEFRYAIPFGATPFIEASSIVESYFENLESVSKDPFLQALEEKEELLKDEIAEHFENRNGNINEESVMECEEKDIVVCH